MRPDMLYVASAPPGPGTDEDGIYVLTAGSTMTARLAARCVGAQYIALHPSRRYLYATQSSREGRVVTFAVGDDAELTPLAETESGGPFLCHLAVDPRGRLLYCANYGDGSISVYSIGPSGLPSPRLRLLASADQPSRADPGRQEAPHAHCVAPHASGSWALSTDLGTDLVHLYTVDGRRAVLARRARLRMPDGSGPRHVAISEDGCAAVSCELSSTVTILRCEAASGRIALTATSPATNARDRSNHPSHVAFADDARYVYVANRGADTISQFANEPGELRLLAETATGGASPRHFAFTGTTAYVANQDSASIARCAVDPASGQVTLVDVLAGAVPRPACVAVLSRSDGPSINGRRAVGASAQSGETTEKRSDVQWK